MSNWLDLGRKARQGAKEFRRVVKGVGDTVEKVDKVQKVKSAATTSDLIKDCEAELETIGADDIPVSASKPTKTGEFIQLALHVDADGRVGEDTIEALNKCIKEEFAPKSDLGEKFAGAVFDIFNKDEFEDIKNRKYKSISDIDGRTLQFLSQAVVYEDGAYNDPRTRRSFAEAMNEIGEEADNPELQMAAHKLAPEVVAAPQNAPISGRIEPELSAAPGMG